MATERFQALLDEIDEVLSGKAALDARADEDVRKAREQATRLHAAGNADEACRILEQALLAAKSPHGGYE